jgi:superfamily II DNA helicase RecQ
MQLRFFTIPILHPDSATAELNRFLASHRILSIDRRFADDGAASLWSICVGYDNGSDEAAAAAKRAKVDYKEVLSEADFTVFAQLRTLRKELADREGVPAYSLFTNDQLAEMVTRRVTSAEALRGLAGVGDAKVAKYGEAFLAMLKDLLAGAPAPAEERGG